MNDTTPEQDRLLDEAIDLIIRHQNDPDNPVTDEMIRAWRARSPQHETAWTRIARVHGASGRLLTEKRRMERMESLGLTRRNLMLGGLAFVGAGVFGPRLILQAKADHMTGKAEMRRIRLPDDSVATLGPESAIGLEFTQDRRTVHLLSGMSFFDVAKHGQTPFRVHCAGMGVTAFNTAFDVSNDGGILSVSVDRGLVRVDKAALLPEAGETLEAGQWISLDPASGQVERGKRDANQIASWRDSVIIAEREPVSALVARIGRWVPGRVVIADPRIGRQKVSGVFDLSDPPGALEAAVHPAGGRVHRISSLMTVIAPL